MTEHIRFYFDPICPWCYQTSRGLRHVAVRGAAELTWGQFSLELQNADSDLATRAGARPVSPGAAHRGGRPRGYWPYRLGAFYGAIGWRVHADGQPLENPDTVKGALDDAGLDPGLVGVAADDQRYADAVAAEHRALVEHTRSFGVPTMVLDDGQGPAIFGPVITEPPAGDAEALALFDHVMWLARYENFSELKRGRVVLPRLESVRRSQAEQRA